MPCDDLEWSNFTKYFAQNFERFGLKKLISTSYAAVHKHNQKNYQPSLFESESAQFNPEKSASHGKLFTLCCDSTGDHKINVDDLEWSYLDGDGDFRSDEVKTLRDAADIVITNPPFSLFREFLAWVVEADKQFVIVGNQNAITYKEVFPMIKNNQMWLGRGFSGGAAHFINTQYEDYATASDHQEGMIRVSGVHWFTNIEHGRRHEPLQLMSMSDNLQFNKKMAGKTAYDRYDNYDAIEVSFTKAIPADYQGVMGVPISFLDKYCPEQFDIVGCSYNYGRPQGWDENIDMAVTIDGANVYKRILIKHKGTK